MVQGKDGINALLLIIEVENNFIWAAVGNERDLSNSELVQHSCRSWDSLRVGIPLPSNSEWSFLDLILAKPLIRNAFPDGVWAAFLKESAVVWDYWWQSHLSPAEVLPIVKMLPDLGAWTAFLDESMLSRSYFFTLLEKPKIIHDLLWKDWNSH